MFQIKCASAAMVLAASVLVVGPQAIAQKVAPSSAKLADVARSLDTRVKLRNSLEAAAVRHDGPAAASILRANGIADARRVDFKLEGPAPKAAAQQCWRLVKVQYLGDGWYRLTFRLGKC